MVSAEKIHKTINIKLNKSCIVKKKDFIIVLFRTGVFLY